MQPVDDRGREVARLLEGRYEVLGLLGRGGFAAVYQVRNLRLQRLEALKVVAGTHEESSEFRQRFEQEARVAASLEHPSILKVYDFGHDAGMLWYSMPFVDGPTLKAELARRGTFDEEAAARMAVSLLDALEYSHGRGVIHRDIKPDNILLDRRDRPYLMDFGIAKTDDSLVKTQTGMVLGSPAYISPEQLRGERLDGRTDVYSLGATLFQAVAGTVPFRSDRMADLAERLVSDAPRLAARKPGVSPEFDRIVARALARLRDERYANARQMRQDLEAFLDSLRRAPAVPAADPASLEDTATLSAVALPPIPVPAPPPVLETPPAREPAPRPAPRRVSAVVVLPPPPPVVAPVSRSASRRARLAVFAAAGLVGLLTIATVLYLMGRNARSEREAAAPQTRPTLAAPPPAPTAVPTALPAPTATALPLPTATATATATRAPAPPARTPASASPTRRPPEAAPALSPPRQSPAAAPQRRVRTKPDVEELAALPLSPEQERACRGKVVGVAVEVGEDGSLLSRRVISPVSSTCDALALEVLARSKFRPAVGEDGRPIEGRFAFVVRF